MRRLFWRIFAAFFLANIAIVIAVAWVTTLNFESEKIPGFGITRLQASMDEQLQEIARKTRRRPTLADERSALESSLQLLNSYGPINYYAFDARGQELLNQPLPDVVTLALKAKDAPNDHVRSKVLITAAGNYWTLLAHADGSPLHRVLYQRTSAFWIQLGVALVISALVSALLAWYVAIPLGRIRLSTRRFAEGDLDVRVGRLRFGRSSEMTSLASEFDRMAERIKALVEDNRRLVRDVSHELRSPLARLRVALELARAGDSELTARSLDRIECEADRLESMLAQAIELSRLETRTPAHLEPLALDELLEDIINNADYEGAPRGRRVRFIQREALQLLGSRDAISSALENIIRNALAYTADDTIVEVSLSGSKELAHIRVRDRGPGVAESELPRLIEPFYRTDAARARSSGGIGLGLAIANSAIVQHGGALKARNAAGGGLEVLIDLPCQSSRRASAVDTSGWPGI